MKRHSYRKGNHLSGITLNVFVVQFVEVAAHEA